MNTRQITTKITTTSAPPPPTNTRTQQYFEGLLNIQNSPIVIRARAEHPNIKINKQDDVEQLDVKNNAFANEIFQQFARTLNLFTYDAKTGEATGYNIPDYPTPFYDPNAKSLQKNSIEVSKILVSIGIGNDDDKLAVFNLLNDSRFKQFINPKNSKNVSDYDFKNQLVRNAIFKSLQKPNGDGRDLQEFATKYAQAQDMALAITHLADNHGNVPKKLGAIAMSDGDVELTKANIIDFLGVITNNSGLEDIYNPRELQNWLAEQNKANNKILKNLIDQIKSEKDPGKRKALENSINDYKPKLIVKETEIDAKIKDNIPDVSETIWVIEDDSATQNQKGGNKPATRNKPVKPLITDPYNPSGF